MGLLLLIFRFALAVVFLVAGLAKLADLTGSRGAMREFGVPGNLADVFGLLLPFLELGVAVALMTPATAWFGAIGAFALLLIFIGAIGYNLAHGRTPDCHCFGQLHSGPAGWPTLIRNLLLAAIAGVVVGFGRSNAGPGALELLAQITLAQRFQLLGGALLLLIVVGEGGLLIQMMKQQGRMLLRIEALEMRLGMTPSQAAARAGLPLGTAAPAFELPTLDGEMTKLDTLRAQTKALVLVFSDTNCAPCTALLPEIAKWQRDHASKLQIALISRGDVEANRAKVIAAGLTNVLLQKDREVAQAYRAFGTPSAVVVREDGTIASPVAQGADAIRALVSAAANGTLPTAAPPALKIGEPAPDFSLPDLAGRAVRLSDFRGHPTLVLFWRPSCGFCARMLPDLKAREANARNGAPKLLVVSTDNVAANEAMGLRSPIVLDDSRMGVGRQFGATGTPMAVLIDAEGRIASNLAAGADAVLALAKPPRAS